MSDRTQQHGNKKRRRRRRRRRKEGRKDIMRSFMARASYPPSAMLIK
jgi:hypothetical protein